MAEEDNSQDVFVIRIWRQRLPDRAELRGTIEHLGSGRRTFFSKLDQIVAFLQQDARPETLRSAAAERGRIVAEQSKNGSGLLKWGLAGAAALAALIVVAGVAFAAYQYFSYGERAATMATIQTTQVQIVSPQHGDHLTVGEPVVVEITASGAEPFHTTELWLNGELMGVQQEQEASSNSLTSHFLWKPQDPGPYQLVARTYAGEASTASRGTLVLVEPLQIVGEVVEDVPAGAAGPSVQPAAPVPGPAEGAPPTSEPPGDATPWQLSPVLWLQSLTVEGVPPEPVLEAAVEGCQVQLTIHDQAENEEGFLVRRQPLTAQAAEDVASLAAMEGTGAFGFEHLTEPGTYTYTARAFNSVGGSDSNPAIAEVDPADCPPGSDTGDASPVLEVELSNLKFTIPADRSYCYRSFDGDTWERWPFDGFFPPAESGMPNANINLLLDELQAEDQETELHLECWGWAGDELSFLGAVSHPLGEPGQHTITDGLLTADIVQTVGTSGGTTFIPLSGDGEFGLDDLGDISISKLYYSLRMLKPFGLISYDPDACKERLPPALQNNAGKLLACFPWPGFDVGPGGDNPQPYLLWFPGNICGAGQGTPPCISYDDWLELADNVGFEVYDSASNAVHVFDSPNWFMYNLKPYACHTANRTLNVRMWAQLNGETIYGPWGNTVSIPCPVPNQGVATVWVEFDELQIIGAEDGEGEPQDVEVYGYFKAWTSIDQVTYWRGRQSDWPSDCPSEAFSGTLNDGGIFALGCRSSLKNGTYSIASLGNCRAPCPSQWYGYDRVQFTLLVPDGERVHLMHSLTDYDSASDNDTVCFHASGGGSSGAGPNTYFEWLDVDSEFWFGGLFAHENGNCKVRVRLNGPNNPPLD